MNDLFERQHALSRAEIETPYAVRRDRLNRLEKMMPKYEDQFVETIPKDFGNRSVGETKFAEFMPLYLALHHTRRHLRR